MDAKSDLALISEHLFNILDDDIGDERIIKNRRIISDLRDKYEAIICIATYSPYAYIYSGSKAEGFRFLSSYDDWMAVWSTIRVVPNMAFANLYGDGTTVLLMDNEINKPGFTFLKLNSEMSGSLSKLIQLSVVNKRGGQCISSKKWRENITAITAPLGTYVHGPCTSGRHGMVNFDWAHCIKSDFWPNIAANSIRRLHQCGWPSHEVIRSIIQDGVIFAAIVWNAKLTETRIFRELSIVIESSLIELKISLIELKSSLIQLESSVIQLESSLIQLLSSLYMYN